MTSDKAVRWLLVCAAVVFALILLANYWNQLWAWLPWSAESRLERAEARADYSESDATARRLEVEGMSEQQARIEAAADRTARAAALAARSIAEARSDPDANVPLPADRLDRLRRVDDGMCELEPQTCAGAATASHPDRGDEALRPRPRP